jgi:hypothetical protein
MRPLEVVGRFRVWHAAAVLFSLAWLVLGFAPLSLASRTDPFVQQGPKLTRGGTVPPVQFGYSVALSADGNTALVGAPVANNGVGVTWVFTRSAGVWTQQGPELTGDAPTVGAQFGYSVALSADGNTALIGALGDNFFAGAAYVFTRSSGVWTQQGPKLTPSDPSERGDPTFGSSAALSADGNTALIGGGNDNVGVGAAWVFTRSSGVWTQQGPKLTGSDATGPLGFFGGSVALSNSGNTALIGAPSDFNPTEGTYPGAAWIFTRASGVWTQQGPKLRPDDETGSGGFGIGVALSSSGNTALIGGQEDNEGVGAAWVFRRSVGSWAQEGPKLTANDETGRGLFGSSVSLSASGDTALIAGPYDRNQRGSAWVFSRSSDAWTQQGPKLTPSDETLAPTFGASVALSAGATTALIGGPSDDVGLGAAWVFAR